jgi:hypothetical protein
MKEFEIDEQREIDGETLINWLKEEIENKEYDQEEIEIINNMKLNDIHWLGSVELKRIK